MTYVEVLKTMIASGKMTRDEALAFLVQNWVYLDKARELIDAE